MTRCAHFRIFAGFGSPGACGPCQSPKQFVCIYCGEVAYSQCYTSDPDRCAPCSEVKRADLKAVFRSGINDRPDGARPYFGTLTAPGVRNTRKDGSGFAIQWDRSQCRHDPALKCSGPLGCKADANDVARWHAGLRKRISYFRQDMRRILARLANVSIDQIDVQVGGVWEPHQRDVLHRHLMFWVSGPVTDDHVRRAFRIFLYRYHFGPVYDLQRIPDGEVQRVAGYLAKYVTKGVAGLKAVPCGFSLAAGSHTAHVRQTARFRAWSQSRGFGMTLSQCRARRVFYVASGGGRAGGSLGSPPGTPAAGGRLDLYPNFSTFSDGFGLLAPSEAAGSAM